MARRCCAGACRPRWPKLATARRTARQTPWRAPQRLARGPGPAAPASLPLARLLPSNGLWWLGLGLSRAAEGRTEAARDALQRARSSGELSPELAAFVEQRLKLPG